MQSRIAELRKYMFTILDELLNTTNYTINANFLDNKVENYSLDKIPTDPVAENWITGGGLHKDIYNFTSRKSYSADEAENLSNIGFFEELEKKIRTNNQNKILPNIKGIQKIECLNCGSLTMAGTKSCVLSIQIQITYTEE